MKNFFLIIFFITWIFICILYVLILVKIYIDIVIIIFQINTQKKVIQYLQKTFPCRSFCSTTYQNSVVVIFWYRDLRVRKKCETKTIYSFHTSPMYFTWRNRPVPVLKARNTYHKNPVCLKSWQYVARAVPYSYNISKLIFCRVV